MSEKLINLIIKDCQHEIVNEGEQQLKRLTEMLNSIILEDGEVKQNNNKIWGEFLHKISNKEWACMIIVLKILEEEFPGKLKSNEQQAFEQAERLLAKHWQSIDRIMDKKGNKFYAWKAMMSALDFVNRLNEFNPYDAHKNKLGKLFYVES